MSSVYKIVLIVALLCLQSISLTQKVTEPKIQIWKSGAMHADEVVGKTGQIWFALCSTESGFELVSSRVVVIDSPFVGDILDSFVRLDSPCDNMILVRGIELRVGPVKSVFSGRQFLKPGQSITLTLSNDLSTSYQLYAEGKESRETIENYRIVLYCNQRRQTILSRRLLYLDGSPSLLWAGDLDRDGKLDLLMDMTNHYNATELTLFLSSKAGSSGLVRKVASHRTVGC